MLEELKYLTGKTVLIVDDEINLCLLMKVYFLRNANWAFIACTLTDAFDAATKILPNAIVMLSPCENKTNIVAAFLAIVPDVDLITCHNEVVYKKR